MRKRVDNRQLDLFSRSLDPVRPILESDIQVTHNGLYLGSRSAFTGGPLNAIESARVLRGLSIARAGVVLESETLCVECLKKTPDSLQVGARCVCLYKAVTRTGPVAGEVFGCTSCRCVFTAHRDEAWKR